MTTTSNGKKAKSASAPFEAFSFPTPAFEVPAAVREFAEKSVSQAREAYDTFKTAADDATGLVEETMQTAREGAVALGLKAVDAAKVNSEASFSFARDLFGARTMSDVMELQSTFARKQFDTFTSQFRDFQALTEKLVTSAAKPVSDKVEKAFKDMKVA